MRFKSCRKFTLRSVFCKVSLKWGKALQGLQACVLQDAAHLGWTDSEVHKRLPLQRHPGK